MENYRLSSYTIPVKLENVENKYALIHGYTGAIDIVSANIFTELKKNKTINSSQVSFSQNSFDSLVQRGYLTLKNEVEEQELVRRTARLFHEAKKFGKKSFLFVVAYDCNFRCPYCFEKNVSGDGSQWSGKVFTKEMVDRAYEAMSEIQPDENLFAKNITLYGGEPLMKKNREIVEYIVNKGKERGFTFKAITNGYDLEAYLDLLNPESINRLQITIDGDKDYHDSRRVHFETIKSFDKIMANIEKALKNDISISIRTNTDNNNFESLKILDKIFEEKGFYQYKKFSFYSALLTSEGAGEVTENDTELSYMTRKKYYERHDELGLERIGKQNKYMYDMLRMALMRNQKIQFRPVFCGAQSSLYLLDPLGDIYPCWDVIGDKKYKIGSYREKIVWENELNNWFGRNIGTTGKCKKCKYALFCGGGCLGKSLLRTGDYEESHCDYFPLTLSKSINRLIEDMKIPE